MARNEIEKLVEILKPQTKKYSAKQIKSAVISEGYSENVAQSVIEKLFPPEPKFTPPVSELRKSEYNNIKKVEQTKQTLQKQPIEDGKKDYFKEVDYLVSQLKELNQVALPKISEPKMFEKEVEEEAKTIYKGDINGLIEGKKQEIGKIKIESGDSEKIQTESGRIINLADYPRREWYKYKEQGKSIAEIKDEKISKLREEISDLRKSARLKEPDEVSEKLYRQLKQSPKSSDYSDDKLLAAAKTEAEKLREKHRERELEREELTIAAENIFRQMQKNPNIYEEEKTEEEKTEREKRAEQGKKEEIEKKKPQKNIEEDTSLKEFSLESPTNNDGGLNTDLEEFNLNLNLDEPTQKEKEKEKKKNK